MSCEVYRQNTEILKSYMQRQRSLVGGITGTFRDVVIYGKRNGAGSLFGTLFPMQMLSAMGATLTEV